MSEIRRVLVVGGGIGGLTAAIALAQRGIDAVVIERNSDFSLPGVGLGQPANALRAYREIGVLDEILETGFVYRSMRYYDNKRVLVADHPFLLGDSETPPVCALSRQELHAILLKTALELGISVRMATTVAQFNDTGDTVEVAFSDGSNDRFDVAIGFDGIRSTTREAIFGQVFRPRPSGYAAWRVQSDRPADVDAMEFLQGYGSKTGAIPLSEELMYLFHIRREDPTRWFDADTMHLELQQRLEGFGSYVRDISDGLTENSGVVYGQLELMLIHGPWFSGRIALGGDAAHVVPPHLTQGAAMAVEDAVVFAQELSRPGVPVAERLARYTQRRYARCAFVSSFARQMLDDEQMITTEADMQRYRQDAGQFASARIAVSDKILNEPVLSEAKERVAP